LGHEHKQTLLAPEHYRTGAPLSTLDTQLSTVLAQGPLTPPGAPAPTMKTLQQVEPRIEINATNTPGDADSIFKITEPGSYYLTGNVAGVSGKHGIEIAASDVTLDLMGFFTDRHRMEHSAVSS
jgi:hypothetical protein